MVLKFVPFCGVSLTVSRLCVREKYSGWLERAGAGDEVPPDGRCCSYAQVYITAIRTRAIVCAVLGCEADSM
jgi:hypothetical protein